MIPTTATQVFAYAIGEEVVIRLDGVEVYGLDHKIPIPPLLLPDWTIARITSAVVDRERPAYLVRTELRDLACICIVDESAIDGVA